MVDIVAQSQSELPVDQEVDDDDDTALQTQVRQCVEELVSPTPFLVFP